MINLLKAFFILLLNYNLLNANFKDKFIEDIIADYIFSSYQIEIANTKDNNNLMITNDEKNILYHIAEAEAGDYSEIAKLNVVFCILNRVFCDEFPNNIKEVVFQKNTQTYQFSPVAPGGRYWSITPSQHTKNSVDYAIQVYDINNIKNNNEGALYFLAKGYDSKYHNTLFQVSEDDAHYYFR